MDTVVKQNNALQVPQGITKQAATPLITEIPHPLLDPQLGINELLNLVQESLKNSQHQGSYGKKGTRSTPPTCNIQ